MFYEIDKVHTFGVVQSTGHQVVLATFILNNFLNCRQKRLVEEKILK